ncbi:hypothetical protein BROUX41_004040 [Berkeleyomyces rouxiae]|uniref:uncharacterized protein n=1 Tax=Berkeleyomyces rouxiae TaxID=2035830 RepID=UPI003B808A62
MEAQNSTKGLTSLTDKDLFIINHVFLPRQLPQEAEKSAGPKEIALFQAFIKSVQKFYEHCSVEYHPVLGDLIEGLEDFCSIHSCSTSSISIDKSKLAKKLGKLQKSKVGFIPLFIEKQNCGTIISRTSRGITVESFELSPLNCAVYKSNNPIKRKFPDTATHIDDDRWTTADFRSVFVNTIGKLSIQTAPKMTPRAKKAGKWHDEIRSPASPHLVTGLMSVFLRTFGSPASLTGIVKNTHDEVLWKDCLLPWRRSPVWLLLRVFVQTTLTRHTPKCANRFYKLLMSFHMSCLMAEFSGSNVSSDLLYSMSAKISKRLRKIVLLGLADSNDPTMQFCNSKLERAKEVLSLRQEEIANDDTQRISPKFQKINQPSGAILLPDVESFLTTKLKTENDSSAVSHSSTRLETPAKVLTIEYLTSCKYDFELMAFESAMSDGMLKTPSKICDKKFWSWLRDTIVAYHARSSIIWNSDPVSLSRSVLQIMELWILLDKASLLVWAGLRAYSPSLPISGLWSLVLDSSEDMKRLDDIEDYLKKRQELATYGIDYVCGRFGDKSSISVKLFDTSPAFGVRRAEINQADEKLQEAKAAELQRLQHKYRSLMSKYEAIKECEYTQQYDRRGKVSYRHPYNCSKCQILREAQRLQISVCEKTLPSETTQQKAVVTELMLPEWLSTWRDSTVFLHTRVFEQFSSAIKGSVYCQLFQYAPLNLYTSTCAQAITITIGSETKPHSKTHRRGREINAICIDDVLLNNGLKWGYWNRYTERHADKDIPTRSYKRLEGLRFKMPSRSACLDNFSFRSGKSAGLDHNKVIACQWQCPSHLSLDEFKALATLPLGYRLQWPNILLQLASPSVDFNNEETATMIMQCIYQAGWRDSHGTRISTCMVDVDLAMRIIGALETATTRTEENWASTVALMNFIFIAARLTSLRPEPLLTKKALGFLKRCREIAFRWIKMLQEKLSTVDHDVYLTKRLRHSILACAASFYVSSPLLEPMLRNSDDLGDFLEVAILNHELSATHTSQTTAEAVAHFRWQKTCYRAFPVVQRQNIHERNSALSEAVSRVWSGFKSSNSWTFQHKPFHSWAVCHVSSDGKKDDLDEVRLNLLTGELLINGRPMRRLPENIQAHPGYAVMFKSATFEVVPSGILGFGYRARRKYQDHDLCFGFDTVNSKSNLRVLATGPTGVVYNLLPSSLFDHIFPDRLVKNYVHWYNQKDNVVEFRPLREAWIHSEHHWKLVGSKNNTWVLRQQITKGTSRDLLPLACPAFKQIAKVFSRLETLAHIEVSFHSDTKVLDIRLPRLKLDFSLKPGASEIVSKQYRGTKVAHETNIGTLHGLYNKLVLCELADPTRLKVLLLQGNESSALVGDAEYTKVTVNIGMRPPKVHAYDVDHILGRLVDNGSFHSKLYLCYMHALTSFCVPDKLTGLTGTEQALEILHSAAIRSMDQASPEVCEILVKLSHLTPKRAFYPENLQEMQTVKWQKGLGFLAQHEKFYNAVSGIVASLNNLRDMFNYPAVSVELPPNNTLLIQRDIWRSTYLRGSEFGAESHYPRRACSVYRRASFHSPGSGDHLSIPELASSSQAMVALLENKSLFSKNSSGLIASEAYGALQKVEAVSLPGQTFLHDMAYDCEYLGTFDPCNPDLLPLFMLLSENSGQRPSLLSMMMWVGMICFDNSTISTIVKICIELWRQPRISLDIPNVRVSLSYGYVFDSNAVTQILRSGCIPFDEDADYDHEENDVEVPDSQRRSRFQNIQRQYIQDILQHLKQLGIHTTPKLPPGDWTKWFSTNRIVHGLTPAFKRWSNNFNLLNSLRDMESQLKARIPQEVPNLRQVSLDSGVVSFSESKERAEYWLWLKEIFETPAPPIPDLSLEMVSVEEPVDQSPAHDIGKEELGSLIQDLKKLSQSSHHEEYIKRLGESAASLSAKSQVSFHTRDIEQHIRKSLMATGDWDLALEDAKRLEKLYEDRVKTLFSRMASAYDTERRDNTHMFVFDKLHQPRFRPSFFLRRLAQGSDPIAQTWRQVIVAYGIALTQAQRAARIRVALLRKDKPSLFAELDNIGHSNWRPEDFPDSLLLEIDSDIMIREIQQDVASLMMSPPGNKNCVTQLNMGEGKSAVIAPIVASALATPDRLMCVLVSRPQSKQMLETLLTKLGRLVNRRIFQNPYSRGLMTTQTGVNLLHSHLKECRDTGGILLVQPEHLLSLKLAGVEATLSSSSLANDLVSIQKLMDTQSRFLIDESDENFSVKFELIYTIGTQQPINNSPQRWMTIQQVLDLVALYAGEVLRELPEGVEISHNKPGHFPRVRVLDTKTMQRLVEDIAENICQKGIPSFSVIAQPTHVRNIIRSYILDADISAETVAEIEKTFCKASYTDTMFGTLLLLRGLLGLGILSFAFMKKRWRVDYGLDSSRTPPTRLAVPYRAKDSPSARAEFSHPEVVMILTSLSYYYGGLSDAELFECFNSLKTGNEPNTVYALWTEGLVDMPESFRSLPGVNLEDKTQCIAAVFPHLRHSKTVIDFFVKKIVFPKEIREFPSRISASGWDLSEVKEAPTTGFSGTNDSRDLLPLGIVQNDRGYLKGTNALVLNYLLRSETGVHVMPPKKALDSVSDADILLDAVTKMHPPVRVILDVGAQILELENEGVARKWLSMLTQDVQTQAVVYFNNNDELAVIDREGVIEPLQTSHFASQLDVCLVFLDESHTRGTDLKLPLDYRAAVTLGAGLTKDRLTQACMRMRKLGQGQSVIFCVPGDINHKIVQRRETWHSYENPPNVREILTWCIEQTWRFTSDGIHLWAKQGERHELSLKQWNQVWLSPNSQMTNGIATGFLEPEAQTLRDRYHPSVTSSSRGSPASPSLDEDHPIYQRLRKFRNDGVNSAMLSEEQERELAPEVEVEQEIQRPPPLKARPHILSPKIKDFVASGVISSPDTFQPAFYGFTETSANKFYPARDVNCGIHATADFNNTVCHGKGDSTQDYYLRSVQWILATTSRSSKTTQDSGLPSNMVMISPYEAERIIDVVKASSGKVCLHLYSPRVNHSLMPLDNLDLYTINSSRIPPSWRPMTKSAAPQLVRELNLFAGQIYFSTYDEYLATCRYLGVATRPASEGEKIAMDGFIERAENDNAGVRSSFTKSPVAFFQSVMSLRRGHASIENSHMDALLNARILTQAAIEGPDHKGISKCCEALRVTQPLRLSG